MSGAEPDKRNLLPSIVVLVFILGYLVSGYLTLDATTRLVPLLAAAVTLLLLLIDIVQLMFRGSDAEDPHLAEGGGVKVPDASSRELVAIAVVAGGVAAVYLLGFLLAIPLYLFVSIAYLGQQSPRVALIVAALASLTIFLVFELALSYRLYPGVLFS
ncbi:MAG: tripartite tricarboxylate transporter TctB family protein [Gammaproteobacteria bacterium]|nr:tripartite tricarboxylate transporter TctB family protein [Gammaproteobacteria bacterium]